MKELVISDFPAHHRLADERDALKTDLESSSKVLESAQHDLQASQDKLQTLQSEYETLQTCSSRSREEITRA